MMSEPPTRPQGAASPLEIRLFGTFEVRRGGQLMPDAGWHNQQTRTILKVLLTQRGRVVLPDTLTEILWPDTPLVIARSRLHVRVSQLRHALAPDAPSAYILTMQEGYMFDPEAACWIDTVEFEGQLQISRSRYASGDLAGAIRAFEAAQALYRGDFLQEDVFVDWTFSERERLREQWLTALTELAECHAQQGYYRPAINLCHQVLAADPQRESAYVRLMVYQYYAGDRGQALNTFERCRRILRDELEVEPLPATLRLVGQIRDGTLWKSGEGPRYPPPVYDGRLFEVPYSLGQLPLAGREREYAWMIAQWRNPRTDVVLVEGEAGVGKTRLVEEFLGYVTGKDGRVLAARAAPGGESAYATVASALRPLISPLREDNLAAATWWILGSLFPEIRERTQSLPPPAELPVHRERERLLEAVVSLVRARLPARTLLYIDDAHHLGRPSLELLARLAGHLVIVLTCRSEECPADHPLRTVLRPLRRQHRLADLALERLSAEAVHTLIQRVGRAQLPQLADRVVALTGGNPLFVVALLQHLFEAGALYVAAGGEWALASDIPLAIPLTMRHVIEARLRRLGPEQRRVLDLAAVIGPEFDLVLLQRASRIGEDRLLDALDALIEVGLVVEPRLKGQAEFSLAHECYGEIAYDTLPGLRRRRLHRQVAQALRAALDHDPALYPRLAYHFRQGGQLPEAIRFAMRAGESALQLYDCPRAAGHFQEALAWAQEGSVTLAETDLAALHFKWGEALRRSGQYAAALGQYEQALPLAHGELKQQLAYQVCSVRAMRGEDGLSDFRRLVPLLEHELADAGETWALLSLHWEQAYVVALQGDPQLARRHAAAGWRVARHLAPSRPNNVGQMAEATNKLARCYELWADWRLALRHAQRTLDICTPHDDLTWTSASALILGAAFHGLGEWNLALDHLERAYRLAAAAGDLRTQAEILYRSGQLYLERGDWAAVEEAMRGILSAAEASGDRLRAAFGQSLAARLGMRCGSPQPAIATLQHHEQMAIHAGVLSYAAQARRYLAEAYLLAGQLDAALATAEQGLALAQQCGLKREAGGLLRIKGVASGWLAGCAGAEPTLLRAVELARRIHCPYDIAEARRDLGQLYLENGRSAEAQAHLEAALVLFQQLGAMPDAARVR